MKLMHVSILVLVIFGGCSNDPDKTEKIRVLKNESTVTYVESLKVLAPRFV
ncbi:hypothetical protein VBD025_14430 [Virgibacillus flavescens]|uniref:hypothetical protein n=1 Tax=Virgibacillus flavescens TaxID=1611422 RepID=UPI003D352A6B